jgi:hypothetical protein
MKADKLARQIQLIDMLKEVLTDHKDRFEFSQTVSKEGVTLQLTFPREKAVTSTAGQNEKLRDFVAFVSRAGA